MEATADVFPTALGWIGLMWTDVGIARLTFGHESELAARSTMDEALAASTAMRRRGRPVAIDGGPEATSTITAWLRQLARAALERYADGAGPLDDSLPLDLRCRTEFQRRVMAACRRIPYGTTLGYRELAERVGSPQAARAVGGVMARNPVPLLVPCHRVLAAGGMLGGFSAPQGLDMKRRLLTLEKAWDGRQPK